MNNKVTQFMIMQGTWTLSIYVWLLWPLS